MAKTTANKKLKLPQWQKQMLRERLTEVEKLKDGPGSWLTLPQFRRLLKMTKKELARRAQAGRKMDRMLKAMLKENRRSS